jgi:hypothetical protein
VYYTASRLFGNCGREPSGGARGSGNGYPVPCRVGEAIREACGNQGHSPSWVIDHDFPVHIRTYRPSTAKHTSFQVSCINSKDKRQKQARQSSNARPFWQRRRIISTHLSWHPPPILRIRFPSIHILIFVILLLVPIFHTERRFNITHRINRGHESRWRHALPSRPLFPG